MARFRRVWNLDSFTLNAGYSYAERLRQHVAGQLLQAAGNTLHLTVSIGLTDNLQLDSSDAMLQQADKRLYAAKAAGRNCTIAGQLPTPDVQHGV